MVATVLGTVLGGFGSSKVGYYTPFAIFGSAVASIGAGLLCTLEIDTSEGKWIGYQVVYGFGFGFIYQLPNLAMQTVLPKKDAPTGFAMCLFGGLLFSSVFLSVGENVMATQLADKLNGIPGFDASAVYGEGATTLLKSFPAEYYHQGLVAYNEALRVVLQIGLVMTCLSVPSALALEWKSVKNAKQAEKDLEGKGEAESKESKEGQVKEPGETAA